MKIKPAHLATDKAVGLIACHHHCGNSRVIIAHDLACGVYRDAVATNHFMVVGRISIMFIIVTGVDNLDIFVQIYTQAQAINFNLHASSATNQNRLGNIFI